MSDNFRLITFDAAVPAESYFDDRNIARGLLSKIYVPPGVAAGDMDAIVAQTGGRDRLATDRVVCPEKGFFPRKLIFFSSAGGSISVPISTRIDLIVAGTAIRDTLVGAGFNVVCVKLVGERFANIVDEIRPAGFLGLQPSTTSSRPAGGGIQPNFYGKAQYASDAIYGNNYILSYKIQSDVAQVFPSLYGGAILTTTGIVPEVNINSCPGSDPRTSRRFIVQSLVTENAIVRSQVAELPQFLHLPTEIDATATLLGGARHVQCVGYRGELNDRFHKLLP